MKRLLNLQDQCNYIFDCYNRYKSDIFDNTTTRTCFDILHWMEGREEFNNIVYAGSREQKGKNYGKFIGEKGKKELVEKLFKDKNIRHRRKTLVRCVENLTRDMYIEEDG